MTDSDLILAQMKRAFEHRPPLLRLLSWSQLPADRAMRVEDAGTVWCAAHPDFWNDVPKNPAIVEHEWSSFMTRLNALLIEDIDEHSTDTPAQRDRRAALRQRFLEVLSEQANKNERDVL